MILIPLMMSVAALAANEPSEPAFTVQLPAAKIGYPGAEYWAAIEGPDGRQTWSFAIFKGKTEWTIPLRTGTTGAYRLTRIEKRQGNKREEVTIGEKSALSLVVKDAHPRTQRVTQALVEAGPFKTFFQAEEPWCVNDHTIIQGPDKTWHLFGITHPKPLDFFKDPGRRLAHATAKTLLQAPWQAQPPAVTADWEKYKEYLLWAPHVVQNNGTYYMFVCAGEKDGHNYRIHLLTSPDLQNWTRSPANPILADGFDGRDPMVVRILNQWVMYYTATTTPEGGNHVVACVTSPDLLHWSDRKIVFIHPQVGTFGGPTESPFVVRRGHHYYLFICEDDWSPVYHSLDPFHWDMEDQVGRIHTHASEIVRDAQGKWYITNAGWMNGPVEMAPLHWKDDQDEVPTSIAPALK